MAFYLGNTRKRSFYVDADGKGSEYDESWSFTSGGKTAGYESFYLYSEETDELCITAKDLDDDEWFSLLEVRTRWFSYRLL